jgi:hypothetical protein
MSHSRESELVRRAVAVTVREDAWRASVLLDPTPTTLRARCEPAWRFSRSSRLATQAPRSVSRTIAAASTSIANTRPSKVNGCFGRRFPLLRVRPAFRPGRICLPIQFGHTPNDVGQIKMVLMTRVVRLGPSSLAAGAREIQLGIRVEY